MKKMNHPEEPQTQERKPSEEQAEKQENDEFIKRHSPSKKSPLMKILHKWTGKELKETGYFWLDVLLNVIIIVALVFMIRTYIISPFQVYGPSMCDTFNFFDGQCQRQYGEYLIVNKFGYQSFGGFTIGLPKRGDVVVFHPPANNDEFFIKRVIGLPGETVKLKDGKVFIYNQDNPDGFELNEPYLNDTNRGNTQPLLAGKTVFEIPEAAYFVLGDNRIASTDSRICFKETIGGTACSKDSSPYLTMDHIEGKAWLVLWPLNKLAVIQDPVY
jgi:signal peptidase I